MSAKERILHSLTRSDFVRGTYGVLREIPVVGAGVRKLVHAAMPFGTKFWIQIPEGLGKGLWMYADPRFDLGYTNGDHEPWIQELLKTELRPGDCYYDVGAHAGFFCLIASRFVGESGKIVAFEPDPENAAALKANIAKNGLTQIRVVEAAVWSSSGTVTFEPPSDASNRTQGHVSSAKDAGLDRISVPAVCLDDLVFGKGHPAPGLIKMDVEGAEWEALQGARRLLTEAKPKLLCEVHDPAQMGQIRAYLEGFGYAAEEWKPVHSHYTDYRQLYLWAIPKS
ncbi:MAG TPA: FkbM family methyltransferase [Candidatus Acidoferrales bacterium]|nr:FkbM family methyltransferase [Candidatus Acidoferrales bacterium]